MDRLRQELSDLRMTNQRLALSKGIYADEDPNPHWADRQLEKTERAWMNSSGPMSVSHEEALEKIKVPVVPVDNERTGQLH